MAQVPFKELRRGEMFCLRAILNQDDDETYMADEKNVAKLTVIADSPSVEIYALDRKFMIYIPDYVQVTKLLLQAAKLTHRIEYFKTWTWLNERVR